MTDLFNKLAAQETAFLGQQILAPLLIGQPIRTKIAGVVLSLKVAGKRQVSGWGIFRPTSHNWAIRVREASLSERQQYLELFPKLRLILCRRDGEQWYGIRACHDVRFQISGLVPVQLATEVQLFDTIVVRWDGQQCWYDRQDDKANLRTANVLRRALAGLIDPANIVGANPFEMEAYRFAYAPALATDIESRRDKNEDRIKDALGRAGAVYQSYLERDNNYVVEYSVAGETHRSVVSKTDMTVQSAGICLNAHDGVGPRDSHFDLQSLVHVISEGQRRRQIVHVNHRDDTDYDED